MKPDWDTLTAEFEGSAGSLVADVDCTADAGKGLCAKVGVEGYPTIKWGDPNALEVYEGGRDLEGLQKFAAENLGPACGLKHLELCGAEKKKEIEAVMARSTEDLEKEIKESDAKIEAAEAKFKARTAKIEAKFAGFKEEEKVIVDGIKAGGLGIMKSVQRAKKQAKKQKSKEEL